MYGFIHSNGIFDQAHTNTERNVKSLFHEQGNTISNENCLAVISKLKDFLEVLKVKFDKKIKQIEDLYSKLINEYLGIFSNRNSLEESPFFRVNQTVSLNNKAIYYKRTLIDSTW